MQVETRFIFSEVYNVKVYAYIYSPKTDSFKIGIPVHLSFLHPRYLKSLHFILFVATKSFYRYHI